MNSKDGIMGLVVGDALGVPVEFAWREDLDKHPVCDMEGYGTYNQPKGSFSDDSSMALATIDSIVQNNGEIDYEDIMVNFLLWYENGKYTPNGECFDIGITTRVGLMNFEDGIDPLECGGRDSHDNGNGSLMRILPAAYYIGPKDTLNSEDVEIIYNFSRLTHGHIRSLICCHIYCEIVCRMLKNDGDLRDIMEESIDNINEYYKDSPYERELTDHLNRITDKSILDEDRDNISSKGYVVTTLEAVLWSLANSESYRDAVLKAVNLGRDTDTVTAICGGIAGIYYGYENIPKDWIDSIIKKDKILALLDEFDNVIN